MAENKTIRAPIANPESLTSPSECHVNGSSLNKDQKINTSGATGDSTIASQVDPSECRSRCTVATQRKTLMKIYKVPLVPDLELQPSEPKKHCRPCHQLVPKSAMEGFPLPGRIFTRNIKATQSS